MKSVIIKVCIVVMILIGFVEIRCVYAEDNNTNPNGYTCNVTLTPDKTSVKPGEDITYTLKVSNINAGNGIKSLTLFVEDNFESNVFDCKIRNYDEDKWTILNVGGSITIYKSESEDTIGAWNTNETLAKIIYTPKTGVTGNTYQAKISRITAMADDNSIININDINLNIQVQSTTVPPSDPQPDEPSENYSCNLNFIKNKDSVKPGEEIAYDVKVSNINAGNGLKSIKFNINNYDSSIFECRVMNVDNNKWTVENNTGENGYFTISSKNLTAWKTDEIVARIIYVPKSGTVANTYQTKITNISAVADDGKTISFTDSNLNIIVENIQNSGNDTIVPSEDNNQNSGEDTIKPSEENQSQDEKQIDNIEPNTSDEKNNQSNEGEEGKSESNNNKSNNNKSNDVKSLPYSGDAKTLAISGGIILFIALSTLFFINYKDLNI